MKGANGRGPIDLKTSSDIRLVEKSDIIRIDSKLSEYDSHVSAINTTAHSISNIDGLQTALDAKEDVGNIATLLADKLSKNSVTGSITVVTGVNFEAKTVTTSTIFYADGQITGVL